MPYFFAMIILYYARHRQGKRGVERELTLPEEALVRGGQSPSD